MKSDEQKSRLKDFRGGKKCINKYISHFEKTRRNKAEMTAQQITSFLDTMSVYFTNQVWYPKHYTPHVSLDKTIKKSPLNVNISTRGKGGTLLKSSTNTKSSISHYRRLITGWRSSTFGICFIFFFFLRFLLSPTPCNNTLKMTFTCYNSDFSLLKSSSKFNCLWHHQQHPRCVCALAVQ